MKMWIARTKKHELYLTPSIPRYYGDIDFWCYNKEYEDGTHMLNAGLQLDSKLYPEVTFENSPKEVELKLIVECSQKLVQLGENLWGKEQKLDKEMQEHQKLCDEIMAIQGIEPIEAEMEEVIHCPEGYIFQDENGNVINATKIVLEKKKKEYPKTLDECRAILGIMSEYGAFNYKANLITTFMSLLICRDAYWKIAGEEMGLGKPWEPDWAVYSGLKHCIIYSDNQIKWQGKHFVTEAKVLAFPTAEMRDAFYENFKSEIEICKELL